MSPFDKSDTRSAALERMPPAPQGGLGERYAAVRATTEWLVTPLSAEDCVVQSMPDASPAKWHLAHTSWFFETFLIEPRLTGYRSSLPEARVLFNSYYNIVGEQHPRPHRGELTRPGLVEVRRYRAEVDDRMHEVLRSAEDDEQLASILELGLQHEQQHQELLLMDIKHLFEEPAPSGVPHR